MPGAYVPGMAPGFPVLIAPPAGIEPTIIGGPPERPLFRPPGATPETRPMEFQGPGLDIGGGGLPEMAFGAVTGFIGGGWAGAALGAYGAYEAGQNGGSPMANGNGVDLYGHAGVVMNGGAVPVGGPGVPEPPKAMVARQWKTKAFSKTAGEYWVHFFRLVDGRMMCYNAAKLEWKMWKPKKPIVLYRGKVTLSQAVRTQRMLDRLWKTVAKKTKALKLA